MASQKPNHVYETKFSELHKESFNLLQFLIANCD